jgi:hypothetical protein
MNLVQLLSLSSGVVGAGFVPMVKSVERQFQFMVPIGHFLKKVKKFFLSLSQRSLLFSLGERLL